MDIDSIYVQKHGDLHIYVMPTRPLKNGGFHGLIFRDYLTGRYGGKAIKGSLAHMHPAPELSTDTPDQVVAKFAKARGYL